MYVWNCAFNSYILNSHLQDQSLVTYNELLIYIIIIMLLSYQICKTDNFQCTFTVFKLLVDHGNWEDKNSLRKG